MASLDTASTEELVAALLKRSQKPKPVEVVATDRYFFSKDCCYCNGKGRVQQYELDGWYLDYHYQDGHEQSGPHSREEALMRYREKSRGCNQTLIGPDNRIYKLKE